MSRGLCLDQAVKLMRGKLMKEIVISREGNRGERGHTLGEEEARFVKSPLVSPPILDCAESGCDVTASSAICSFFRGNSVTQRVWGGIIMDPSRAHHHLMGFLFYGVGGAVVCSSLCLLLHECTSYRGGEIMEAVLWP